MVLRRLLLWGRIPTLLQNPALYLLPTPTSLFKAYFFPPFFFFPRFALHLLPPFYLAPYYRPWRKEASSLQLLVVVLPLKLRRQERLATSGSPLSMSLRIRIRLRVGFPRLHHRFFRNLQPTPHPTPQTNSDERYPNPPRNPVINLVA